VPDRNERAAPVSGFNDEGAQAEAAEDPVASWEIVGLGCGEGEFGDADTLFADLIEQLRVLGRVGMVESASRDGGRVAIDC